MIQEQYDHSMGRLQLSSASQFQVQARRYLPILEEPLLSKKGFWSDYQDDFLINQFMEFIEATAFTKYVYDYLSEDEFLCLQSFLLQYPEAGKIVRGSGGVRKVRWAMAGQGKSGGVRVVYYFKKQDDEIWLLTIYSKNEVESIPAHVLRQIAKEIENG